MNAHARVKQAPSVDGDANSSEMWLVITVGQTDIIPCRHRKSNLFELMGGE
jgi:hypothetical protein